jgi:hypothetical protein
MVLTSVRQMSQDGKPKTGFFFFFCEETPFGYNTGICSECIKSLYNKFSESYTDARAGRKINAKKPNADRENAAEAEYQQLILLPLSLFLVQLLVLFLHHLC